MQDQPVSLSPSTSGLPGTPGRLDPQSAPAPAPAGSGSKALTYAQLAVSGLGLAFSLLFAFAMALFGLIGLLSAGSRAFGPDSRANVTALFGMAWISLLAAALATPSLAFSIQRLGGRIPTLPRLNGFRLSSILLLVWPLALLLGGVVSRLIPSLAWLALPPLQVLAIGLPVWWLVEAVRRGLPVDSQKRGWGLVNFSVFITTPLLMVVEVLVMLVLGIGFAVWASTQPQLVALLQRLVQRLANAQTNPDAILEILGPYLQNPLLIFGSLALIAGLVPLIEELFKPLAVWALAGRPLTPAGGFAAGALCGAAFALIESLFYLSNPTGDGWAALAAARAGTGLLHTTTSALVGWGLASAWQDGAYLRLGAAYLLAVFLHGAWNALSVLTGLVAALSSPSAGLQPLVGLARLAPYGMAVLVIILLVLLFGCSSYLRQQTGLQPHSSLPVSQSLPGAENLPGSIPTPSSSSGQAAAPVDDTIDSPDSPESTKWSGS